MQAPSVSLAFSTEQEAIGMDITEAAKSCHVGTPKTGKASTKLSAAHLYLHWQLVKEWDIGY